MMDLKLPRPTELVNWERPVMVIAIVFLVFSLILNVLLGVFYIRLTEWVGSLGADVSEPFIIQCVIPPITCDVDIEASNVVLPPGKDPALVKEMLEKKVREEVGDE